LFIEDYNRVPRELRKDFLNLHIERLRGMFSAFHVTGRSLNALQPSSKLGKQEIGVATDFDLMYELAREVAKQMTILGKKYVGSETEMDGETFFTEIYSEALRAVMAEDIWRNVFEKMTAMNVEIFEA